MLKSRTNIYKYNFYYKRVLSFPSILVCLFYFRKNSVHRADFSHPGDNDYDTDPDDDRPLCPFGDTCYRRNLHHRRQYKHSNPPVLKPSKINFQVNVTSCPFCPHCNSKTFPKPDYESDYDSDHEC